MDSEVRRGYMAPTGLAPCLCAVEALGRQDRSPGTSKLEHHPQTGNPQSSGEAQGAPTGPAQLSASSQHQGQTC